MPRQGEYIRAAIQRERSATNNSFWALSNTVQYEREKRSLYSNIVRPLALVVCATVIPLFAFTLLRYWLSSSFDSSTSEIDVAASLSEAALTHAKTYEDVISGWTEIKNEVDKAINTSLIALKAYSSFNLMQIKNSAMLSNLLSVLSKKKNLFATLSDTLTILFANYSNLDGELLRFFNQGQDLLSICVREYSRRFCTLTEIFAKASQDKTNFLLEKLKIKLDVIDCARVKDWVVSDVSSVFKLGTSLSFKEQSRLITRLERAIEILNPTQTLNSFTSKLETENKLMKQGGELYRQYLSESYDKFAILIAICASIIIYRFILVPLFAKAYSLYQQNENNDAQLEDFAAQSIDELKATQSEVLTKLKQTKILARKADYVSYAGYAMLSVFVMQNYALNTNSLFQFLALPFCAGLLIENGVRLIWQGYTDSILTKTVEQGKTNLHDAFAGVEFDIRVNTASHIGESFYSLQVNEHDAVKKQHNTRALWGALKKSGAAILFCNDQAGQVLVAANQTFQVEVLKANHALYLKHLTRAEAVLRAGRKAFLFGSLFDDEQTNLPQVQLLIPKKYQEALENVNLEPFEKVETAGLTLLILPDEYEEGDAITTLQAIHNAIALHESLSISSQQRISPSVCDEKMPAVPRVKRKTKGLSNRKNEVEHKEEKSDADSYVYPLTSNDNVKRTIIFNLTLAGCGDVRELYKAMQSACQNIAKAEGEQGLKVVSDRGFLVRYVKLLGKFGDVRLPVRLQPGTHPPVYETDDHLEYHAHQRRSGFAKLRAFGRS